MLLICKIDKYRIIVVVPNEQNKEMCFCLCVIYWLGHQGHPNQVGRLVSFG